jgi:hypothetical protein
MNTPDDANKTTDKTKSREAAWAKPIDKLKVSTIPKEAMNLNVEGRQLTGPLRGFGQMWQKTYTVRLSGSTVTPTELIQVWKENFPRFWPQRNYFYGSLTGIAPGEVAVLNLAAPAGMSLSTGVLVIYVDDESFSFMTPQGHQFAGMITFSAHEEDSVTEAQIQALIRASDPMYEIGCRLGLVHRMEDDFWHGTLKALAAHFGVTGHIVQQVTCVDTKVQWAMAGNIWHNAAIRTALYTPVHLVRRALRR